MRNILVGILLLALVGGIAHAQIADENNWLGLWTITLATTLTGDGVYHGITYTEHGHEVTEKIYLKLFMGNDGLEGWYGPYTDTYSIHPPVGNIKALKPGLTVLNKKSLDGTWYAEDSACTGPVSLTSVTYIDEKISRLTIECQHADVGRCDRWEGVATRKTQ